MGKKEQRIKLLRNELKRQKSLRISDIEEMFQISESTARSMCSELETSGEAIRTFGGIQYMPEDFFPNLQAYSFDALSEQHVEEKKKIGMYASTLVCPGDTIFLSGGTTVFQFACCLAALLEEKKISNIDIMTNSIANAEILSSSIRVILTGGEYRAKRRDTAGIVGEKSINNARFSKAFIGVDGLDITDGLMAWDIDTARIDYMAMRHAREVYLLADSSKFQNKNFINYEKLLPEYTVITDNGLPEEIQQAAQKSHQSIIVV